MRAFLVAALALAPTITLPAGLLGEAVKDLNRASAGIEKAAVRVDVDRAVGKIERAEIAQVLQIDALTNQTAAQIAYGWPGERLLRTA